LEAASGFEPESRGFAEDEQAPKEVDRVRPTRHEPHQNKTLHASYPHDDSARVEAVAFGLGQDRGKGRVLCGRTEEARRELELPSASGAVEG